jgi:hypothetical protein
MLRQTIRRKRSVAGPKRHHICTTPGPILPTGILTGYGTTVARLWITILGVPTSGFVISIPSELLRRPGWQEGWKR